MERKSDIPEDPAEHAVQFSADWCDRLEIEEGKGTDHDRAVEKAADTELPISERARNMLRAIARDAQGRSR